MPPCHSLLLGLPEKLNFTRSLTERLPWKVQITGGTSGAGGTGGTGSGGIGSLLSPSPAPAGADAGAVAGALSTSQFASP
eukprot:6208187-Pleurochrysis_carterae.AAC.1